MNDPAQHTTVINALHSPHVRGQKRRDPIPLRIRKPKEISHIVASKTETLNHRWTDLGSQLLGPDPSITVAYLSVV
ncbi:hypothetical protein NOI24_29880 [Neorhizobium galegae]|uniref:hypothetical protein n=1 Tax=Neorhizobium galegae TaxID=399 RepID=UPI0021038A26|nr:hypothetical protein [Neorhizobium galegae]MCQ1775461.1 hypothetical protein [Neorhizobium galegae]